MKSILISIKPQYVEKILNGEKTIEIRKTKPNIELPCKVYIYCTMPNKQENRKPHSWEVVWLKRVVAEFTLKNISYWQPYWAPEVMHICDISEKSCVSIEDLMQYCGNGIIYALHIEDLEIYDKPKELSEFTHNVPNYSNGVVMYSLKKEPLKRPFQSWGYVNGTDN